MSFFPEIEHRRKVRCAPSSFYCTKQLLSGLGIRRDAGKADRYLKSAALTGLADAMYNLALCHIQGEGTPRDRKLAIQWLKSAAEAGHMITQFCPGTLYACGKGVPPDKKAAFRWYSRAAKQSLPEASDNLGACYQTERDSRAALKWYARGAQSGDPLALNNLLLLLQQSE